MLDLAITALTHNLRLNLPLQAWLSDARNKTLLWQLRHWELFPQGDWNIRTHVIRSEANRRIAIGSG
jgi:hypothetical protein